jgi:hypothetical protein
MDNIITLERKLAACRKQQKTTSEAKYPSGVVIDLLAPEGNTFAILGICKDLARQYDLSPEEIAEFNHETRLDGTVGYAQILDQCQKWFGLVYMNRKN